VVAYSRLAAVRYREALTKARDELVQEAIELDENTRKLGDVELQSKPRKLATAVRAWRSLELIRTIEFAPVISPDNNDDPGWSGWTDAAKIEARIARFKKPLVDTDPKKADPLAFLIVKSMLITGFDAPVEGVMYLDRPIKEAELLQAIARVNRPEHGKAAGIVVDYYGVARHLKEALAAYSVEDIEGALRSMKDEIPKLRDRRDRCAAIFLDRGVRKLSDTEACVDLLEDERLRADFTVKLKHFLDSLDLVLPRPEGLPFVKDAKTLAFIYARARNRYREGMPMLGKAVGGKVRELIDEHVISLGIDPKIPPISITDAKFAEHIGKQVSPRAKASEISLRARRPILYDFTAAWCGPCRLLDRDWDDAAIARTVDASFVPVRIVDRQREDGRNAPEIGDLQSKYEISGFPTLVLTAADGRLLGKLEGYRGRAALVKFLNEAPRN
jgi:type I restriction enzyme R subunit